MTKKKNDYANFINHIDEIIMLVANNIAEDSKLYTL